MMEKDIVRSLVSSLQERGTGLSQDDVAWAFDSPQTRDAALTWAVNYISQGTLLTEDEHELHQWLRQTGFSSEPTSSRVRPILDSELQHTLRSLEASTATIERQTRQLEAQRSAVLKIQRQRRDAIGKAQDAGLKTRGQRLHESSRLGFMMEELEDEFQVQLDTMLADLDHAVQHLSTSTDENLVSHNDVLDAVAQLASKTRGTDFVIKPSELDAYCRRLIEFRTSEMRSRFGLLLQEQLIECVESHQQDDVEAEATELGDLMNEIQTMTEEIANVMEVVIANDVRQPLLKSMRAAAARSKEEQILWSEYIFSTLKHMIAQTQVLHEHLSILLDYDIAYRDIEAMYRSTSQVNRDSRVVTDARNTGTHKRAQPRPLLTHTSSGSSVLLPGASVPVGKAKELTMSQILSRLNISATTGSTDQSVPTAVLLDQVVQATYKKLSSQYDHALSADKATLATALTERDDEAALVRERLTAFAEFSSMNLSDQHLEQKVDELDSGIQKVARGYATAETLTRTSTACAGAGKLHNHYGQ